MLHEPLQNLGEGNLIHFIASNVCLKFLYKYVFSSLIPLYGGGGGVLSKRFGGNLVKTAALAAHVVFHVWRLLY